MDGPPKVSQAAIARACKIAPASVNDWLSGKSKAMEGRNLIATAKLLKVSPEWLGTGKGPKATTHAETSIESHPAGPEPAILHEAVTLLLFDLDHGGPRSARSASDLLLDLYRRIDAAGGRLPAVEQRAFEEAARSRGQAKTGVTDHVPRKATTKHRKAG